MHENVCRTTWTEKRVRVVKIRNPELVLLAPHWPAHDALIELVTTGTVWLLPFTLL